MTETYSLAATGHRADELGFVVDNIKVGDSAGLAGSQRSVMATGAQVLCKRPDGSQAWFTLDAERSVPGVSIVLKAV